jgi:nucleotidyltransferase/DNA polymerase involved in DNA repair
MPGASSPRSYALLRMPVHVCIHNTTAFMHQMLQFDKYEEASEAVYKILLKHTTAVQPISCDEAYLDVTGLSDPFQIAAAIRAEVTLASICYCRSGLHPSVTAEVSS